MISLGGIIFGCQPKHKEVISVPDSSSELELTAFPTASPNDIDLADLPYKKLSAYGFFQGALKDLMPSEQVLPYAPASSLFTDYAHKSRYLWMPADSTARVIAHSGVGDIDFPEGSILIKNFYYPEDFRVTDGPRRVLETRLMVKQAGKWEAYPYVWNGAQTDADYKVTGAEIPVSWVDEAGESQLIQYIVPNKNQCKSCHNRNEELVPIGVQIKHLNYDISHKGRKVNQLVRWEEHGFLKGEGIPSDITALVDYRDDANHVDLRAKAYLDINCGHCHQAAGPASTSGLFLTYEETDPMKLGVYKTPVAAGFGAGTLKFDVVPGKPEESILLHRMSTNEVGAAMPEIGRVTVHKEGVDLVRKWIQQLPDVR
nr:hypothetical protein [Cytophagales bacterium]